MYSITKDFHFSASHALTSLPKDHKCHRLHGHNYIVRVELRSGKLNRHGFVRDYGELDAFKRLIDQRFDHRHLNDVMPHILPTAENMAGLFFTFCRKRWVDTFSVSVSETPKTWATYYGEEHRPAGKDYNGSVNGVPL